MIGGDPVNRIGKMFCCLLTLILFLVLIPQISDAAVSKISVDELNSMMGTADLTILDVRKSSDWEKADQMIRGAVREDPGKTDEWMNNYPKDKKYVLYCA
jgi:LPS O-antigen subunit length determinant protein (WzzB/FepE family)